jgi:CRISPR-associated protein Cas1
VAKDELSDATNVDELMGVEATARRAYYSTFDAILPEEFVFDGRSYDPPQN